MHKIINIEDSSLIRLRVSKVLQQNGYTDVTGYSSADPIKNAPQLFLNDVDLIISDVSLPGVNGIELTIALNNDPRYCNIPIIIMSMRNDLKTINEAIKAGAIDYIAKPFEDELLIRKVRNIIGDPLENDREEFFCDIKQIKNIARIECERATRGQQWVSFIKLNVKSNKIQSGVIHIINTIRKIDKVYILDDNIIITLPLTDIKGLAIVYEKIHNQLQEYNIEIIEKNFFTYDPEAPQSVDALFELLE
ncbi:MAG: response regulator [Eubacteriales bacterium]